MCIPFAQGVGANGIVIGVEIVEVRHLPRRHAQYRAGCSSPRAAALRRAEVLGSYPRRFWCEFTWRHIAQDVKRPLAIYDAALSCR
jgi:hypothetical protein